MTRLGPRDQSIRAQIKRFACRDGGVFNRDIQLEFGISAENSGRDLSMLQKRGDLFCGKRSAKGQRQKWFGTQAEASDYTAGVDHAEPFMADIGSHLPSLARKPGRAPIKLDGSSITKSGSVTFRHRTQPLTGDATMKPGVSVQHCPAPMFFNRVQVDPDSRPDGAGFSAAGIGRYLED